MRLPWTMPRSMSRGRTRRKRGAPLKVRRLERRRVLDAAVTELVLSPTDLDGATEVHDTNEGTTINASATATGFGDLFYEWTLRKDGAIVEKGYETTYNYTPQDDGNYSITLKVTDSTQSSASQTQDILVHNVQPVLTVAPNQTVDEGSLLDLSALSPVPLGSFVDPGLLDTHTATVDWGDGSPSQSPSIVLISGVNTLAASHAYTDSGVYTVTVTVTDDDGGSDTETFSVTVNNVEPTATLNNSGPVDEGSSATVSFTNQFDPSTADTTAGFRYAYDFNNDGTFDVGDGTYSGSVMNSTQMVSAALLADGPATRTVKARIIDKDGGFTDYTTDITVGNVAPKLTNIVVEDSTIEEGDTAKITMNIDDSGAMDVFSVEVDWQDGSPDTITGLGLSDAMGVVGSTSYTWDAQARELTVRHLYLDDNPTLTPVDTHAVALTVRDDDLGGNGPYTVDVTVANVLPVLTTAGNQTLEEGDLLDLSSAGNPLAMFVDEGILDSFKATVDWGDGTPLDGPILQSLNGSGTLLATHVYENSGTFTVTVTISDDDGGVDTKQFMVTVGNVAPTAVLTNNGPVDEGSSATVTFSNQFDPSVADTVAGFRYAYDFNNDGTFEVGDGTYSGSVAASSQIVSAAFLADGPAMRTVRALIIDQDGGSTEYFTTITVNNVDPELVNFVVDDATIDEGQTATITARIDDPGSDTFEVDVDWKDGGPVDTLSLGLSFSSGTVGGTTYVWNAQSRELTVSHKYLDDNPTLTSSDLYTVVLAVRDDDGGASGPYNVGITVSNVAPVLTVVPNQTVNEGAALNLTGSGSPNIGEFTDQGILDTYTATIDWGDGTPLDGPTIMAVNGTGKLGASHIYADDGVYTVTVTLKDDDGGMDVKMFQVTVENVAPTLVNVVATDDSIDEGQTAEIKATINDPGAVDTFSVDVDWKDGLPADTISGLGATDAFGVVGSTIYLWDADTRQLTVRHLYLDDNPTLTPFDPYAVELVVRDDDLAQTGPYTVNITVSNVVPVLDVVDDQTVAEGSLLDLSGVGTPNIGTFLDKGILDSHTATIDWGDGTPLDGPTIMTVNGAGKLGASHTYADNGVYTVKVTVRDDDGGVDTEQFQVTVSNVDPTLEVTPSAGSVLEGATLSFDAMFSDPGFDNPLNPGAEKDESFTYDVDWGDGRDAIVGQSITDANGSPGSPSNGMFNGSHVYADDGVYMVTVTIHDDDGGSDVVMFQVTVGNDDPDLSVTPSAGSVLEGATLSFDAMFSDPGFDNPLNPGAEKQESFTYDVDWGDGRDAISGQTVADTNGGPGTPSTGMFNESHIYADDGTYTVTVTIHDDDGGIDVVMFQVTVNNADPTLSVTPSAAMVNEGSTLSFDAMFSDPGFDNPLNPAAEKQETFTYDVNWGDGRDAIAGKSVADTNGSPGVPSTGEFNESHIYADDGTYTVTVTIHDDNGGSDVVMFQVMVKNVAPTVAVPNGNQVVNEGALLSLSDLATFTDPGFDNPLNPGSEKSETFTYDLDWGDGRDAIVGQNIADINGGPGVPSSGTIAGSHIYADNGTYTVTVTVYDDDGDSHTQQFQVTVDNVDPTLSVTHSVASINESGTVTFDAMFSDPGFDNPLNPGAEKEESFTFDVDWGDGRNLVNGQAVGDDNGGPNANSTGSFGGSHIYADDGTYTVKVTIHDDDGGSHVQTFVVVVSNVAPALTGTADVDVNEGALVTLGSMGVGLTDPGFDNPNNPTTPAQGNPFKEEFLGFTINWGDGTTSDVLNVGVPVSDPVDGPTTATFTSLNQLLNRMDHVYADNGDYTVTIRLADDNMGAFANAALFESGTAGVDFVDLTFVVHVHNVTPTLTLPNGNLPANGQPQIFESQTISLTNLGVITDPGFNNPNNPLAQPGGSSELFKYWVDWNDDGTFDTSSTDAVTIDDVGGIEDLTDGSFDQSHTYADNGTYTVRVRIADDDMGAFNSLAQFEGGVAGVDYVEMTFTIVVTNVPPKLNPFPNGKKLQGDDIDTDGLTTIRLSLHDPGFDNSLNLANTANGGESYETFTYVVDWGDQTVDAIHLYTSNGPKNVTVTMDGVTTFSDTIADSSPLSVLTLVTAQDGLYDPSVAAKLRTFTIDWGDGTVDTVQLLVKDVQLTGAPGAPTLGGFQTFVVAAPRVSGGVGVETVAAGEIQHTYIAPPDPLHPTADVPIRLTLVDDDGGMDGGINDANAVIFVSNPGIESTNVAIDTTPDVPRLDLTQRPTITVANLDAGGLTQLLQIPDVRGGGGEVAATTERYLELRIVYPDGTESKGFKIKDEALTDLRAFFATLPDGKYRIYLVRTENKSERLVIEVDVRRGRVIDVSDDSEGTRDRPPTEEDSAQAVPLDQNPLLEEVPAEGAEGAEDAANRSTDEARIIVIRQVEQGEPNDEADDRVSLSPALPLSLTAAALAVQPWSEQVDTALAEADETAWRRLRRAGRNGRGARPSKLPFFNRMRVPAALDYNNKKQ